jgi:hypothetical protein
MSVSFDKQTLYDYLLVLVERCPECAYKYVQHVEGLDEWQKNQLKLKLKEKGFGKEE